MISSLCARHKTSVIHPCDIPTGNERETPSNTAPPRAASLTQDFQSRESTSILSPILRPVKELRRRFSAHFVFRRHFPMRFSHQHYGIRIALVRRWDQDFVVEALISTGQRDRDLSFNHILASSSCPTPLLCVGPLGIETAETGCQQARRRSILHKSNERRQCIFPMRKD